MAIEYFFVLRKQGFVFFRKLTYRAIRIGVIIGLAGVDGFTAVDRFYHPVNGIDFFDVDNRFFLGVAFIAEDLVNREEGIVVRSDCGIIRAGKEVDETAIVQVEVDTVCRNFVIVNGLVVTAQGCRNFGLVFLADCRGHEVQAIQVGLNCALIIGEAVIVFLKPKACLCVVGNRFKLTACVVRYRIGRGGIGKVASAITRDTQVTFVVTKLVFAIFIYAPTRTDDIARIGRVNRVSTVADSCRQGEIGDTCKTVALFIPGCIVITVFHRCIYGRRLRANDILLCRARRNDISGKGLVVNCSQG